MIQVRRSTYRGKDGWKISGYPTKERSGWPVSIFCEKESAAREIAARLREDPRYEVTLEDFER